MLKKIKIIPIFIMCFCLMFLLSINVFAETKNVYYYGDNCLDCKNLKEKIEEINDLKHLEFKNVLDEGVVIELQGTYGTKKIPFLVVDGSIYQGTSAIIDFYNELTNKNTIFYLFMGFLDGFNPCAISLLMIFSTFLSYSVKNKKYIAVGLSFITGTFLANFLLGFSIIKISNYLKEFEIFTNIIFIIAILMCVYIFCLNMVDIFNYKSGKIKNKLTEKTRFKAVYLIQKAINNKFLVFISFVLGFVIAFIEFSCTGQVYLPTLLIMKDSKSILNLILYNFMFIVPLLIFFVISMFLNADKIREKIMKKSYLIKIIVNIFLVILLFMLISKIM